jgi:MFS family permease
MTRLFTSVYAWVIVIVASLAFAMEFASMNILNIINQDLVVRFQLTDTRLGWFSATYFIANVIFIPISGILLDKFSAKWLLVLSVLLSVLGISFLGYAPFWFAVVLRFISGACNPLTILGAMRIGYNWLPPSRWGLASSLVVSFGMLGGLASQDPLSYFLQKIEWQHALLWFLVVGIVAALLIVLIVRESPKALLNVLHQQRDKLDILSGLKQVLSNLQNWRAGLFTAGMNTPVNLLGGLWGVAYVMAAFHVSHFQATLMMSVIFIGAAIGGIVLGFLSDLFQRRKIVCILSALITLGLLGYLMSGQSIGMTVLEVIVFCLGFLSSAQDLSFAVASESNASQYTGMSIAMVALAVQGSCLLFQPISGYLIDLTHPDPAHLVFANFHYFIWIFPVMALLALVMALWLKETHCQRTWE